MGLEVVVERWSAARATFWWPGTGGYPVRCYRALASARSADFDLVPSEQASSMAEYLGVSGEVLAQMACAVCTIMRNVIV